MGFIVSNTLYMALHKVESIKLDGSPRYPLSRLGPGYAVVAFNDNANCTEYLGAVDTTEFSEEYIQDIFTPVGALIWIRDHEDEFDSLFDFALENGIDILGTWYDPKDLQRLWEEYLDREVDD